MSVQQFWNLSRLLGVFTCCKLANYVKTSSLKRANNVPKLPGVDGHDVKGFATGSFLERIVVERANDDLC